ncbi:uncharacterized protein [Temnothorax longispinosus]|uniref:uncharacterized protein n=1 Tax=Temnothorax longispinosus TaxID=300112 RepID=UPI003A98DB57
MFLKKGTMSLTYAKLQNLQFCTCSMKSSRDTYVLEKKSYLMPDEVISSRMFLTKISHLTYMWIVVVVTMQQPCIGAIFARFAVFGMYKWSTRILERSQEFDTVRVRRKHSPDTMNTHGANYYVPIENESCTKQHNDFDKPRCMPRILGRRFALTSTAYKYLDVGINVGPMSFVDILIGDNRGNQIVLPHATWTALIERRMDIEQLLESTIGSSLSIHDAVIELVKMRDASVVKLTSCNTSLYMKPSTMLFIFELGQCVKHEYFKLYQNTHEVNMKFNQFVTILRRKCIIDRCNAANILREIYDENSIIDCELLAYALDTIVYNALHDK